MRGGVGGYGGGGHGVGVVVLALILCPYLTLPYEEAYIQKGKDDGHHDVLLTRVSITTSQCHARTCKPTAFVEPKRIRTWVRLFEPPEG